MMNASDRTALDARLRPLFGYLKQVSQASGTLAIACSGGLDSRLLVHLTYLAGLTPLVYHVSGPHIPPKDTVWCREWAQQRGFSLHVVECDPLGLADVASNTPERCYACKKALFSRLLQETEGTVLCDGSNASDQQTYRPGLRALRELGILSPLAHVGFDKAMVRELALLTGLEHPKQPSRPCLLTRLDYGVTPTAPVLTQLDLCESLIESRFTEWFDPSSLPDFRVRRLADSFLIQVSVPLTADQEHALLQAMHGTGIPSAEVTLVSCETISGYFDRRNGLENPHHA